MNRIVVPDKSLEEKQLGCSDDTPKLLEGALGKENDEYVSLGEKVNRLEQLFRPALHSLHKVSVFCLLRHGVAKAAATTFFEWLVFNLKRQSCVSTNK
jgi:hypothetical protein